MTLRVGFDATPALHQFAGIGRYARELLAALAGRDDEIEYRAYYASRGARRGFLPDLGARVRVSSVPLSDRILNALWQRAGVPVPVQLFVGRVDVFHSPDFSLPPTDGAPSILTIHDLAFLREPDCAYPSLRQYLTRVVPRAAARATHIIAVSESTRRDVLDLFGLVPERVTTVHEGVDPFFRPLVSGREHTERLNALGVQPPYILSVSTLEPRKNYVRLLEAFAELRRRGCTHQLVIAGSRGWLFEPIFESVRSLGIDNEVLFLAPQDTDLLTLYNHAEVFVYPSLYEGFGLPPLEAMACGTPVACSNTSSFPEVVGDAAQMFDPHDTSAIAESIELLLSDGDRRRILSACGPERAAMFTWKRAADRTVELYRHVVDAA